MSATTRIPQNLQGAISALVSNSTRENGKPQHKSYLAPALYSLTFIERVIDGTSPAAVDSSWRCYYDPNIINNWSVEAIAAVLEHEVWHLLRRHHRRAKICNIDNESVAKVWNIAADMEIHSDPWIPSVLRSVGFEPWVPSGTESEWEHKKEEWARIFDQEMTGRDPFDEKAIQRAREIAMNTTEISLTDMPPEWLCERYFAEAIDYIKNTGGGGGGGGKGGRQDGRHGGGGGGGGGGGDGPPKKRLKGGSGADDLQKKWEDSPTRRYVDKAREDYIVEETAKQIMRMPAGTKPGKTFITWAKDILTPKVDWREVLNQTISSYIHAISGFYEYTRRKPSRRQGDRDYIVPGMQQPIPDISVVLDTSGSMMWGDRLTTAMTEIRGILEAFGNSIEVRVYATDAAVHSVECVYDVDSINALGGGGTDMGVGIYAAAEDTPTPSIIICVTDGETPWPDVAPPDVDVFIVALVSDPGKGNMPPSWVTEVVLAFDR